MKKFKWNTKIIKTQEDINEFKTKYDNADVRVCAMDTETDGLHIIHNKPFVYQFGFVDESANTGYSYAVEIESPVSKNFIIASLNRALKTEIMVGSNIKFDLHMLKNIGYDYRKHNVTDTTYYIRWGTDNVPPKKGGALLGIKSFCAKYIYPECKDYDKLLKVHKTKLKRKLKREVGYHELPREDLITYALEDIVMTLEGFYYIEPIVKARDNMYAVELENKLLWVLLDMERVGFKVDKKYLKQCKINMAEYISKRQQDLKNLAGEDVAIGQHARLKTLLNERFGVPVTSTGKPELDLLINKMEDGEAKEFITILQELRTLEKWYSTYLLRFLEETEHTDIVYTVINQVGTVSGRVSSDFQQFPKKGILTTSGQTLFEPRRMITTRGEKYDTLIYLDYSQIELRVQALYTILVDAPDHNLCRAYMPYKCINNNNERFDYLNKKHLQNWNKDWYLEEDPESLWAPTDLHGVTTTHAFDIDPSHEDFEKYRSIGKRVNFAKNYGASRSKIAEMFPQFGDEQITKIDGAYYKAYPGVKRYHSYCYNVALSEMYVTNLFGVKYYGVSGHNLINMLVQGSSATLLKIKMIEVDEYLKKNKYKSKIQMNIHDEISFEKHVDDPMTIFRDIKHIMEKWDDSYVPIVCDMEISKTTWADKEKYNAYE